VKEQREERYTGIIFVVLKNTKDMELVAKSDSEGFGAELARAIRLLLLSILQTIFCCCDILDAKKTWTFKRASEPTDINFQNLGIGLIRRKCQTILVYIATTIILVLCGLMIWAIKKSQNEEIERYGRLANMTKEQ
jgi:hypothetical protein